MKLQPYDEYRDSGISWLGVIPAHWDTNHAKRLFHKMDRPVGPSDEIVTCFRDGVVTLRKNRRTEGFTESLQEIGYQGVRRGDLVIHAMDAFAGAIGVSDSDGKCTPVYAVCKPTSEADPHYYARVVREMARTEWIRALAKGIRERSTDFRYAEFAKQVVPIPPIDEQAQIKSFLAQSDRLTQRLIRTKQRLIELLDEQKQAIIHRAVTRGLDPNAPMKPTGIDWIPEVPEHWKIKRLKHICRLKSGDTITSWEIEETGKYPVYGGNGLRGYISSYTHQGEYVLIGRQGALCGNINYAKGQFWASEHAVVASLAHSYDLLWFGELLRTMDLNQYSQSAAQPGLAVDRLQNLPVPVPTAEEQHQIAALIKNGTVKIDAAINRARREIELIREYHTRLLSDVVTGKLDVRGVDLPEVEEAEMETSPNGLVDLESLPEAEEVPIADH